MPTYKIRGISVDFPFEAYDCQLLYMEKVIESLQNKCNALLESPTGTGKTLCLLCATLAWRKSLGSFSTGRFARNSLNSGSKSDVVPSQPEASNFPTIIYTSRTHSQIRQVIQELKRSSYRPKMVVLGSREQLCIHDEVRLLRGKAQTNACHALCRKRGKRHCAHFLPVADYVKKNPCLGDEPIDIEDLVNIGKGYGPCPYYMSRELHKVVDILFAPYNYLIDRGNRKSLNIDWNNSILIFDEAHNLESLCADAASFDLASGLLTACISEAKNCIDLSVARRDQSNDQSNNPDNFAILRALLLKLEKRIAEVPVQSKELGFTKPGPYIYELLGELNVTHDTAPKLIGIIEEAVVLLEEENQQRAKGTTCRLESIGNILQIVFRDKGNAHANSYRVHVQEVEANAADALKGKASRTLSWWCFNPGIALEAFSRMGVGSIILTSGTLSPLDSFAQELKLDFPVRLENPHVISTDQVWAGVVPVGPSGRSFNSSYRNRDSIEYKQELGNAIVNFARIVPDGLLVFFPSYYLLDQAIGCWKKLGNENSTTIWERICKHKQPVIEPRQSSLFTLSIEDYMTKLKDSSTSGAIFFAVCRGKVSEGLDFADQAGRAVVITGLPFATMTDPKVRLKREYLDQQGQSLRERCKILTGEEWYNQQASRAVNQAVGRVIRHRYDYGAIIFCDERFAFPNRQSQISRWIQPHIMCYSKFGDVVFTLTQFFRKDGTCGPPKPKLIKNEEKDRSPNLASKSLLDKGVVEVSSENTSFYARSSMQESAEEMKNLQPMDKSFLQDFLTPMKLTKHSSSMKSLSFRLEVEKSKLGDVVPANRSSLGSLKANQPCKLKHSSDLMHYEKKLLIPGKKTMQYSNCEIIDLTSELLVDEKPAREELLAPCSSKKQKILKTEHGATQHAENTNEHATGSKCSQFSDSSSIIKLVKRENALVSKSQSMQIAEGGSSLLSKEDGNLNKSDIQCLSPRNRCGQIASVPCDDEETRGAAFLIQVQEKLSAAEYKEFVGFMKALKSKTMKIGHILQSIVRLFSRPERHLLLKRFRDYVPSKYHSLYEQYLEINGQMPKNPRKFEPRLLSKG
ncbi:regulator of telomere elongation helicase 1 homolog isoform X1 [Tripterygium wilfordii]|uniref:regulator of telomere elongation helicase 1 homolog isoform X1 n=2 Tax=Tripterygium wilfordii TaxID=458696 RepID=UPI0018F7F661|nr:regulator of telomere elongation helicase 1 homolog isoform X1 [Tripterygium wilfordii]